MNKIKYVNMQNVIGNLANEYGTPILQWEDLVTLGQRAVNVYGLTAQAERIPFPDLCEYIIHFIRTPFGKRLLVQLSDGVK